MRLTPLRRSGLLASAAVAAAVTLALATTAFASPGDLDSGDPRATVHEKNATTCEGAELPGTTIQPKDIKAEVDGTNTYIDVLDHTGITAVVVKGGDAYNVYLASALTDGWTDLHSPLNPNGKPAQISHWFACGDTEQPPPSSSVSTPPSSTASSSAAATPSSSSAAAPTTTTSAQAAAAGESLASTGFGSAWMIGLGAALLAAGAAVLLVLRRRRA